MGESRPCSERGTGINKARYTGLFDLIGFLVGAGEGIRTPDRLITNQLLYQLSYASLSSLF